MRFRRQAERRKRSEAFRGIALLSIALLFFSGLAAATYFWPSVPCKTSPESAYAVLLDVTSRLSDAQRLDVKNKLRRFVSEMPEGARLQFWQVTPTGSDVPSPLDPPLCKPRVQPNQWIENVEEAKERNASFNEAVDTSIERVLNFTESSYSPILEGIQAIWLRYMDSKDFSSADDRRLLIVSDLVQHTPGLSLYKPLTFDQLKANKQYQQVRVNLKGAKVEVLFLKHDDGVQVDSLIRLWEQILDDMAGDLRRVERVTG